MPIVMAPFITRKPPTPSTIAVASIDSVTGVVARNADEVPSRCSARLDLAW